VRIGLTCTNGATEQDPDRSADEDHPQTESRIRNPAGPESRPPATTLGFQLTDPPQDILSDAGRSRRLGRFAQAFQHFIDIVVTSLH
jgi:hypothetical protein